MSAAAAPSDSAGRILQALKTRGALDAQAVGEVLGISAVGARQHLLRLEQRGLVRSSSRAEKVGRPARLWELAPAAWAEFPDRHGELSVQLIAAVRAEFGEPGMERLIAARERDTAQRYATALQGVRGLAGRLQQLAELRSAEGYMASVVKEGSGRWLLIEDHCPVCAAARACQGLCRSELELFRDCLAADVERCEYLLDGARRCAYRVRSRAYSAKRATGHWPSSSAGAS